MEWLNLHTSVLDSPEVVGEEPVNRATWLFLLRYCIGQENAGIVINARSWGDRKWQQLVRVTSKEVARKSDLWEWIGDDLVVSKYPKDKESEIKHLREIGKSSTVSKRAAAKANGEKGGRPKNNPTQNPTETQQETQIEPIEGEGKGRVREGEGECAQEQSQLPVSLTSPDMIKLWPNWLVHWSETFANGKAMPEQTAHAQLRSLVTIGPERAAAAINNAITRGLREPAEPFVNNKNAINQTSNSRRFEQRNDYSKVG